MNYIIKFTGRGKPQYFGPPTDLGYLRKLLAWKGYTQQKDGTWKRRGKQIAEIVPLKPRCDLPPRLDGTPIHWHKCNKGGGYETIYRGLRFIRYDINGNLHVGPRRYDSVYVPRGESCDDLVREYQCREVKLSRFRNWQKCLEGCCRRITCELNKRRYWARYDSNHSQLVVFNQHRGGRPIGILAGESISQELREWCRNAK